MCFHLGEQELLWQTRTRTKSSFIIHFWFKHGKFCHGFCVDFTGKKTWFFLWRISALFVHSGNTTSSPREKVVDLHWQSPWETNFLFSNKKERKESEHTARTNTQQKVANGKSIKSLENFSSFFLVFLFPDNAMSTLKSSESEIGNQKKGNVSKKTISMQGEWAKCHPNVGQRTTFVCVACSCSSMAILGHSKQSDPHKPQTLPITPTGAEQQQQNIQFNQAISSRPKEKGNADRPSLNQNLFVFAFVFGRLVGWLNVCEARLYFSN